MKYFEMEEKRLKSFLKMEELWGKERKEGKKVRKCPKSCHLNCVCGAFSKAEVSFIALKLYMPSHSRLRLLRLEGSLKVAAHQE